MNYDTLIRRANKVIDKISSRANASGVHTFLFGEEINENNNGLIIVYSEKCSENIVSYKSKYEQISHNKSTNRTSL